MKIKTINLTKIREAVANYLQSEGCSCCRGIDHDKHLAEIAKLLEVPMYKDGSGYNFNIYKS